jgi:hypothetical protein
MPLDNPRVGTTQHTPKPHLLLLFWLRNILNQNAYCWGGGQHDWVKKGLWVCVIYPTSMTKPTPFPSIQEDAPQTPQIMASWAHLTSAHKNIHTITICAHKMLQCFQLPRSLNYKRFVIQREFQTGLWIHIKTLLFHWAFGSFFWLLFCVYLYIYIYSFCAQK